MIGESRRIFFALWPDSAVRSRLEQLMATLPEGRGRAHAVDDLHLTLVFIGQANAQYYDCLRMAATRIEFEAFEFELMRFGYFAKAKVLAAEPPASPPLSGLARGLGKVLRGCGFKPERREYSPHVTLLRNSPPLPQLNSFAPIMWKVDRFCLVESREPKDGRRYKVLEEFMAV
jgi:RNA 2',3'-cyclic 3'-phosphodiesterase